MTDFTKKQLKKNDWVIRAAGGYRSQVNLVYSHLEEDPKPWGFGIRTYQSDKNKFGRWGNAEHNELMIRIDESEVPKEILEAYRGGS